MRLDTINLELLRNYFQGIADEMAHVVERTAYTTFVKETGDFTTGLLTPRGEFFAYPIDIGVAGFVGINYAKTIEAIGSFEEGDVVLTNDPYTTNAAVTHLPDLHVLKPVFFRGRLICFAYAFLHCSDIGGMVAASISPRAYEIFQEGLRLPPKKIIRKGVVNQDLVDIILANCRIPEQNWGDLKALFAGLTTGERRIHKLIQKFGIERVTIGMEDLIDYTAGKVRRVIEQMPKGRYDFADYIEDDVASDIPIRLKVSMVVGDVGIHLDFTGTDPQVSSALNLPTGGVPHPFVALALINYFISVDPSIPLNAGLLRPLTVELPVGSVVNPVFPAACGVRYATVLRVYDTVLGALTRAVPDHVPAAGAGQGCMIALSLLDASGRRSVTVVEPMIGGGGGRPRQDGINGCDTSLGYLRTTPVESLEAEIPIVVRRFHLEPESAGAGRFRSGFGIRLDFQVFEPDALVTARGMERLRFQPWGIHGGSPGSTGRVLLNPDTPQQREVTKIDVLLLEPGDVLSIRTPGGGGYGDPFERSADLVCDDVMAELLTVGTARERYGVVITEDGVDEPATKSLRRERQFTRGATAFDLGPARREHEAVWTPELYEKFLTVLMAIPMSYRPYVRRMLYGQVHTEAQQSQMTPPDLDRLWSNLARSLPRLRGPA